MWDANLYFHEGFRHLVLTALKKTVRQRLIKIEAHVTRVLNETSFVVAGFIPANEWAEYPESRINSSMNI